MANPNTRLSVDELEITRALRVAVASAVLCTSFVVREATDATVSVHLREVDGAVETAREVGDVDIEGELPVQDFEELFGARQLRPHSPRRARYKPCSWCRCP